MEDVSIGPSRQGKRLAQGNQQQEVGTSGDRGPVSFLQTEAGSRRLSRGANQALLLGPRCQVRALLWAWFPFPHCGHSDGVTTGGRRGGASLGLPQGRCIFIRLQRICKLTAKGSWDRKECPLCVLVQRGGGGGGRGSLQFSALVPGIVETGCRAAGQTLPRSMGF